MIRCLEFAPGRTKHAARNSLHHLSRAWAISQLDPEMAAFRCLTAEEEAATALFISLRQLGYEGARQLNFKRHDFKAALYPFLLAVWKLFGAVGPALPFTPQLAATTVNDRRLLELRLRLPSGAYLAPDPPLNFRIGEGENSLPHRFTKQLEELARSNGKEKALEHIREAANLRNLLLYADDDGRPKLSSDVDGMLRGYQRRVFTVLRVLCLVFPYQERALFVDQCIAAFLIMMGVIEEEEPGTLSAGAS